jgi:hypothetical protein
MDSMAGMNHAAAAGMDSMPADGHSSMVTTDATSATADGYTLTLDASTVAPGNARALSFVITSADATPLTTYAIEQTKPLHLIVVRSDLSGYQHLHPTLGPDNHWHVPVNVTMPGRWRVIADFTPELDGAAGKRIALGTDLTATGSAPNQPFPKPAFTTITDGYTVIRSVDTLTSATPGSVTFTVTKGGSAVTDITPYLGAFGHLVAIRASDLAYLHLHPTATASGPDATAGPAITFEADIPTGGAHAFYLQFATASGVHTAMFTVNVA